MTAGQRGTVLFKGAVWQAEAVEDVSAGSMVSIIDKKSIRLIVENKKQPKGE